jgi:protoheme IX farnesyltransferase
VPFAIAPAFTGVGGWGYLATSVGGGAVFLLLAARLYRSRAGDEPDRGPDGLYGVKPDALPARNLFAFSILYLFLLFLALLAEHALGVRPLELLR